MVNMTLAWAIYSELSHCTIFLLALLFFGLVNWLAGLSLDLLSHTCLY